jgi:thioredoxin-related protein
MFFRKYLILLSIAVFILSCTSTEEHNKESVIEKIKPEDIPKSITILFVTQPHCPSCDRLAETMKLKRPNKL